MEPSNQLTSQSTTMTGLDFLQTHYPSFNKVELSEQARAAFSNTMIQDALMMREIEALSIVCISNIGYLAVTNPLLDSLNITTRQRIFLAEDVYVALANEPVINCIKTNIISLHQVLKMTYDTCRLIKKPYILKWIEQTPSCINDLINAPPSLYKLLMNPSIIRCIEDEGISSTSILSLSPFCHTFLNSALVMNALDRELISIAKVLDQIKHSAEYPLSYNQATIFFAEAIEEQQKIQTLKTSLAELSTSLMTFA